MKAHLDRTDPVGSGASRPSETTARTGTADGGDPSARDTKDQSRRPLIAHDEPSLVRERYARRTNQQRYSLFYRPALLLFQERQRAIVEMLVRLGWQEPAQLRLLEVGCGGGVNLHEFLRLGFRPEHLQGIELLESRADQARHVLPSSLRIFAGDAAAMDSSIPSGTQDIVFQSVVFSSLLDDAFQKRLADRMWNWVRPGGGVLWYDFIVNNPRNPDVRGVPVSRIRELFPAGRLDVRRLTLAPPIARTVTRVHPVMYSLFNSVPWLRTHVLVWIAKEGS
jgi:SAM-dependent methyltransferase